MSKLHFVRDGTRGRTLVVERNTDRYSRCPPIGLVSPILIIVVALNLIWRFDECVVNPCPIDPTNVGRIPIGTSDDLEKPGKSRPPLPILVAGSPFPQQK